MKLTEITNIIRGFLIYACWEDRRGAQENTSGRIWLYFSILLSCGSSTVDYLGFYSVKWIMYSH